MTLGIAQIAEAMEDTRVTRTTGITSAAELTGTQGNTMIIEIVETTEGMVTIVGTWSTKYPVTTESMRTIGTMKPIAVMTGPSLTLL